MRVILLALLGLLIIFVVQSVTWGMFHDVPFWWAYGAAPAFGFAWTMGALIYDSRRRYTD